MFLLYYSEYSGVHHQKAHSIFYKNISSVKIVFLSDVTYDQVVTHTRWPTGRLYQWALFYFFNLYVHSFYF